MLYMVKILQLSRYFTKSIIMMIRRVTCCFMPWPAGRSDPNIFTWSEHPSIFCAMARVLIIFPFVGGVLKPGSSYANVNQSFLILVKNFLILVEHSPVRSIIVTSFFFRVKRVRRTARVAGYYGICMCREILIC